MELNLPAAVPGLSPDSEHSKRILATLALKKMHVALKNLVENQISEMRSRRQELRMALNKMNIECTAPEEVQIIPPSSVMAVLSPHAVMLDASLMKIKSVGNYFGEVKSDIPAQNEHAQARQQFESRVKFGYPLMRWDDAKDQILTAHVAKQLQKLKFVEILELATSDSDAVLRFFQEEAAKSNGQAPDKKEDDLVWYADPFQYVKVLRSGEIWSIRESAAQKNLEHVTRDPVKWEAVAEAFANVRGSKPTPSEARCRFWQHLRPSRSDYWAENELTTLRALVAESASRPWTVIASILNMTHQADRKPPAARTPYECIQKFFGANETRDKTKWTHGEDAMLTDLVLSYGIKNWQYIAGKMGHRTGPQCMHRWSKALSNRSDDQKTRAQREAIAQNRIEWQTAAEHSGQATTPISPAAATSPESPGQKKSQKAAPKRAAGSKAASSSSVVSADASRKKKNITYWNFYLDRLLMVAVMAYTVHFNEATDEQRQFASRALEIAMQPPEPEPDDDERSLTEDESEDAQAAPVRAPAPPPPAAKKYRKPTPTPLKGRGRPPVDTGIRWSMVQLHIPGKLDTQCRERYYNTLGPKIDWSDLSKDEEARLDELIAAAKQADATKRAEAERDGKEPPKEFQTPWSRFTRDPFFKGRRTDGQLRRLWSQRKGAKASSSRPSDEDDYEEAAKTKKGRSVATSVSKKRKKSDRTPRPSKKAKLSEMSVGDDEDDDEIEENYGEERETDGSASGGVVRSGQVLEPSRAFPTQEPCLRTIRAAVKLLVARDTIVNQEPEIVDLALPTDPTSATKEREAIRFATSLFKKPIILAIRAGAVNNLREAIANLPPKPKPDSRLATALQPPDPSIGAMRMDADEPAGSIAL